MVGTWYEDVPGGASAYMMQQVLEVQNFTSGKTEKVNSRIREIASLASSVTTLQGAITAETESIGNGLAAAFVLSAMCGLALPRRPGCARA